VVERRALVACVGHTVTLPCHPHINNDVDWNYRTTETSSPYRVYSNTVTYERFRDRLVGLSSSFGGASTM